MSGTTAGSGTAPTLALIAGSTRYTLAEMERECRLAARRLTALGAREGDVVALIGGNSADWALLAHAIPQIGAILMPVNTRLAPDEVRDQVTRSNASLILRGEEHALPSLPKPVVTIEEFRAVRPADVEIPDSPDPSLPCALLFTSGSTGRPKGALLTWSNQVASAAACAAALQLGARDRWLVCLPLFHVGGLNILYRCALHRACAIVHEKFDPAAVNAAIDDDGATILSVVSVMLRRILEDRRGRPFPPSLRAVIVGGGAVDSGLTEACPQAIGTYGLTETCSMVTLATPDAGPGERASAGRPLPGIELRVVDAGGRSLPPRETGSIEVRGPIVMMGYVGEAPLRKDEWLRTGDLGLLDPAGTLYVAGRREDLIVSGGENVYPAEIEAAIRLHPGIAEVVVLGAPDATWGEVPVAFVVLRDPEVSTIAIARALEERLARFKIPEIVILPEIPRLPNGKPDRARLASRAGG